MNKGEFVDHLVKKGLFDSNAAASRAVDAVFGEIEALLKKGDEVNITGFGKFSVSKRKARTAKNPRTGEDIKVPAHKAPHFKAGAVLKRSVH